MSKQELSGLETLNPASLTMTTDQRDQFVSLKMYLIDKAYFDYERRLTNEDISINTLGSIGTLASTAVAAAIPAGQTTKALAAVATGLNGATGIYDDKVLLTKTIQALQIQMRTDRDTVAARIFARRPCDISAYNIGMALSDLESYARAGTFESALQTLTQTITRARDVAADTKQTALDQGVAPSNLAKDAVSTAKAVVQNAPPSCPISPPRPRGT